MKGTAAIIFGIGLLASACTGSVQAVPDTIVTTTTAAPTTTASTEAPSTTLNERQIQAEAIEAAEEEITQVVIGWGTDPYDTSEGEAGMPLQYLTGAMYDRYAQLPAQYESDGGFARSVGSLLQIDDIRVDLATGQADVDVCIVSRSELVDIETGEIIAVDDDLASTGDVFVDLVDGEWLISEYFYSRATGEREPCEIYE